jgi:hypothetical protein
MTAMHAITETKHVARHAAVKEPSKLRLPKFHLPKRAAKVEAPKIVVHNWATGNTKRVTATGHALYSVDSQGQVGANAVARSLNGFATFADSAGSALDSAYSKHWIVQIFETEVERKQRVNAQAVGATLQLLAVTAAKLARR